MFVASVEQHPDFSQVITVQDVNAYQVNYLMTDGVLQPVRIWTCFGPNKERVSIAIPMPDGPPSVLRVDLPSGAPGA